MMKWLIGISFLILSGCAGLPEQAPAKVIENAEQLGVTGLEFDAQGNRFATTSVRGEISIWSYPENKRLAKFWDHTGKIQGLYWAGDRYLLTGGTDRKIVVFDVEAQSNLNEIELDSTIQSISYVPEKNWVVSGHLDGTVRVHTLPDLKFVASYETDETVLAVAASSRGVIASSGDRGQTLLFENGLKNPREIARTDRDVIELRFSPDGLKLLCSGWSMLIWDVQSGLLTQRSTGHLGTFSSLDVSPNNQYVATVGCQADANVQLFDLDTGVLKRRLLRHELCGNAIRFSRDGRYVVTASEDESVRFYDLNEAYPGQ